MLPVLLTDTVTPDLDRALHYALLWGVEGVALRTMGPHAERVPYVNEAKLRRRLDEHELPLAAVEPGLFEGAAADRVQALTDLGALGETGAFCQRLGCGIAVVGALADDAAADATAGADVLRRAGAAAARYGLTLAVRNRAGTACATGRALAALLDAVDHARVQAAWDASAALRSGGDVRADAEALAGRVALAVVRDGRLAMGSWEECAPGEGDVGWAEQLRLLRAGGFSGPLCLEVHGEPHGPFGLAASTALVKLIRAQRRAERASA